MRHITLVAVVDGLDDLAPEELRFELWHLSIRLHLQVAMQAASIDKLHNEEHLLMGLKSLIKLRNVGMIQAFHNFHLTFD